MDIVFHISTDVVWSDVDPVSPYFKGIQVIRGSVAMFPEVHDAANKSALWVQKGVAGVSVYLYPPLVRSSSVL